MSTNLQTLIFIASVGLGVLGMDTFLIASGKLDGSSFTTLSALLVGGVVGLLAPSPLSRPTIPPVP